MHKIAVILNASIEAYITDSERYWDKSHDSVPNLHPTPHTLHPASDTLHPTPCTIQPALNFFSLLLYFRCRS